MQEVLDETLTEMPTEEDRFGQTIEDQVQIQMQSLDSETLDNGTPKHGGINSIRSSGGEDIFEEHAAPFDGADEQVPTEMSMEEFA